MHNARLAHADLTFHPHASPPEGWEEVHFTPKCHKRVTFWLNENLAPYIRVSEIERGFVNNCFPLGMMKKCTF